MNKGTDEGNQEGCFHKQGKEVNQEEHLETGGMTHHVGGGPQGEAPGLIRRQEEQEKNVDQSLYCDFRGKNGRGRLVGFKIG